MWEVIELIVRTKQTKQETKQTTEKILHSQQIYMIKSNINQDLLLNSKLMQNALERKI